MTEYKYKLNITQIIDEEDTAYLKPLGYYNCNILPQANDQIAILISDEDGTPQRRIYLQVVNFVHFCNTGDEGEILENESLVGELQTRLLVDEPIDK